MEVFTYMWRIENYSYCWNGHRECLKSPEFTVDGLEGSAWCLRVFPRVCKNEGSIAVHLSLNRSKFDAGPDKIYLPFGLSVLAANGSTLSTQLFTYTFKMGRGEGCPFSLNWNDVHLRRKGEYLSEDTLKLRCKIWPFEGNVQQVQQISARTRIGIERVSFLLMAENFSTLQPNVKKNMQVGSISKAGLALSSSLHFTADSWPTNRMVVEITSNKILAKCVICLVDKYGEQTVCGETDNRFAIQRKDFVHLILNRQLLLDRRSTYLPDGILSLKCECIFSKEIEFERIEGTSHESHLVTSSQVSAENMNECPRALDDFKALYENQLLTDIELKTNSKSFPAHKLVLCARSSVFHAMLTNDMKERNTGCIQIDDLEDDIVQQFLLFLYSDHFENLQWESAIKLYYAGDKYDVKLLKTMCSAFLVDNLSTPRASELLLLADTHNDSHLRKNVEDFILQHAEEVFGSEEWESLMKANARLALETMHLRYKRRRL